MLLLGLFFRKILMGLENVNIILNIICSTCFDISSIGLDAIMMRLSFLYTHFSNRSRGGTEVNGKQVDCGGS
jgi:hypothetical protein